MDRVKLSYTSTYYLTISKCHGRHMIIEQIWNLESSLFNYQRQQ